MMLGGTECSGSICFHYEEMNIMLTKCVAVKRGPGLLCMIPDVQIRLVWHGGGLKLAIFSHPTTSSG